MRIARASGTWSRRSGSGREFERIWKCSDVCGWVLRVSYEFGCLFVEFAMFERVQMCFRKGHRERQGRLVRGCCGDRGGREWAGGTLQSGTVRTAQCSTGSEQIGH